MCSGANSNAAAASFDTEAAIAKLLKLADRRPPLNLNVRNALLSVDFVHHLRAVGEMLPETAKSLFTKLDACIFASTRATALNSYGVTLNGPVHQGSKVVMALNADGKLVAAKKFVDIKAIDNEKVVLSKLSTPLSSN